MSRLSIDVDDARKRRDEMRRRRERRFVVLVALNLIFWPAAICTPLFIGDPDIADALIAALMRYAGS